MTSGDILGMLSASESERAKVLLRELRAAGVDVEEIKRRSPIPVELLAALESAR